MADPISHETEASDPSYIDYELFLSPTFSAPRYANTLVLSTNNASDTPLDLSTPLSRVLFDIQEVDSHIHTLSSKSALLLLSHTKTQTEASQRITEELGRNLKTLNESYARLEKEVIHRHAVAAEVQLVASRLSSTVRLGRSVARALQLGRQLEVQMSEAASRNQPTPLPNSQGQVQREDHRAMVRAASTILTLRSLFATSGPGEEGKDLGRVNSITALQRELVNPAERSLHNRATQAVKDFALSTLAGGGAGTYAATTEVRARTVSALSTLYVLSPNAVTSTEKELRKGGAAWEPEWLVQAVQEYIRNALSSSATTIGRALSNLPSLDGALLDVAARCQNIVSLEQLLLKTPVPSLPTAEEEEKQELGEVPTAPAPKQRNLLPPILAALETSNLTGFFWRSLAGTLAPRVNELVSKGGPTARGLRQHREEIRDMVRDAVERGCAGVEGGKERRGEFEREVAVMVGAVTGPLGR